MAVRAQHGGMGRQACALRMVEWGMTELLDEAFEVLRSLPENLQANAARAIFEYAATYEEERVNA